MKRTNLSIMYNLFKLLGSKLILIIMLAVLNGTIGFLTSISITVLGSIAIAKLLGASILISNNLLLTLIIVFGLLRGLLRYIEQYSNHFIAFKILAVLRDKIFQKLISLSPAKLEDRKKGSIISMIESDIETLEVFYAHTISPIFIAVFSSIILVIFISLMVNPYLGALALINYIIVGYIAPKLSIKKLNPIGKKYRNDFSSFNGFYMNLIKGTNNTILNNNQEIRKLQVNDLTDNLLNTTNELKNESAKNGAWTGIVIVVLNIIMLFAGMVLVNNNVITTPYLIIALITQMSSYGPVLALSNLPNELNQTFASANHVLDLLEEKPLVNDIEGKTDFDYASLEIKNLNFSYDKKTPVLKDFNLKLKKNEIVGLLGNSGSGKSTILKLILRFWKPDSGEILVNNKNIEELNTKSLRQNISMVSQTTYLFDDTIKNNLLMANRKATDEDIIEACKKASIHDFISKLENGYDTVYSPKNNIDFSSGEKQRIGLARAFLSDSKLILIDEPTSNVDAINEGIILNAIKNNTKEKSVILISHRKSSLSIADRIITIRC